jgi:hypothetical protein
LLNCTLCNTPLGSGAVNTNSLAACGGCGSRIRADIYPALTRPLPLGQTAAAVQLDKEAGCFYHPLKKAVVPCTMCGRFLCALCDLPLNNQHLCPACLERGRIKRNFKNLENHRTCYDTIALLLVTVSCIFYWVTILTAPIAIYLVVRHWNSPSSIIPRTKIRFILAFILAGMQISAWGLFFIKLVQSA